MASRREFLRAGLAASMLPLPTDLRFKPPLAATAHSVAGEQPGMALPPGVSGKDFVDALSQFSEAVGPEWVFTAEDDLALYRDAYSPVWGEDDERLASAAVAPATVEQVQQVVRIANTYKIPIYPISTGKNLGYGGSAPNYSGSVVVDLKRMNRILEVDDTRHFALVEPGVSYFDLYRLIQERGLKVWIDVPDPGWGSLVGNALDHGVGYTVRAFRDHFDAHCGMEVVLANGEVMRTGMGAMPGAGTWQDFKYGFGPGIDGLFAQGNYGIVTKMGFWLMPEPEAYLSGTVIVPRHDDVIPLVSILNHLENSGIFNGPPSLQSPLGGSYGAPSPPDPRLTRLLEGPGALPILELERYAREKSRGFWSATLAFYGPAKVIAAQWGYARERFSAIAGARFEDGDSYRLPLTAALAERVNKASFGIPALATFSLGARSERTPTPTSGHTWFSAIVPRTGEAMLEAQRVLWETGRQVGIVFNRLATPGVYGRSFIFMIPIPVTRDAEANRRNRAAFRRLLHVAAEHGWGEYRAAPVFQSEVADTYSFNSHALRRFCETVKDAVDPNGILAAGRGGIWPKHLRGTRA